MKATIKHAINKEYTEFSNSICDELKNKLSSHPEIASYSAEYDRISSYKDAFAEINSMGAEEA